MMVVCLYMNDYVSVLFFFFVVVVCFVFCMSCNVLLNSTLARTNCYRSD